MSQNPWWPKVHGGNGNGQQWIDSGDNWEVESLGIPW